MPSESNIGVPTVLRCLQLLPLACCRPRTKFCILQCARKQTLTRRMCGRRRTSNAIKLMGRRDTTLYFIRTLVEVPTKERLAPNIWAVFQLRRNRHSPSTIRTSHTPSLYRSFQTKRFPPLPLTSNQSSHAQPAWSVTRAAQSSTRMHFRHARYPIPHSSTIILTKTWYLQFP